MAGILTPHQRFERWRKTFHRQNLPTEQIKTALGAIGIMAVCTVTLGAPLLRLADASPMAVLGICSGSFALSLSAIYLAKGRQRWAFFVFAAVFFFTALVTAWSGARLASARAAANDARCSTLQSDMLSARPRKEHGPELFQVLGCSPIGTDATIFVPPAKSRKRPPSEPRATAVADRVFIK